MRFAAFLAILLVSSAIAGEPVTIPEKEPLAKAEEHVRTVFGEQIQKANSPEAHRILAERLESVATDEKDLCSRYAILQEARRQAVDANDILLGLRITRRLASDFAYRPDVNLNTEEWLEKGDAFRCDSKTLKRRREALALKLFAVECYLRAYPNATGLNRELVEKKITEVVTDGGNRKLADLVLLVGTWNVASTKGYNGQWVFSADGTVTSPEHKGKDKGMWAIAANEVRILWKNDAWETFHRPLTITNVTGDSSLGRGIIRAEKVGF